MRIGMIGFRGVPHTYGGGEELARHLAPRLAAKGHDVTVYCRSGYYPDRAPLWQGVHRVFYPAPEHKSLGQFVHAAGRIGLTRLASLLWERSWHTWLIVLAGSIFLTWGWSCIRPREECNNHTRRS